MMELRNRYLLRQLREWQFQVPLEQLERGVKSSGAIMGVKTSEISEASSTSIGHCHLNGDECIALTNNTNIVTLSHLKNDIYVW